MAKLSKLAKNESFDNSWGGGDVFIFSCALILE